jgi:hypothetical protein
VWDDPNDQGCFEGQVCVLQIPLPESDRGRRKLLNGITIPLKLSKLTLQWAALFARTGRRYDAPFAHALSCQRAKSKVVCVLIIRWTYHTYGEHVCEKAGWAHGAI